MFDTLAPMIDALAGRLAALVAAVVESADLAVLTGWVRAVGATARSTRAVAALTAWPVRRALRPTGIQEDQMSDPNRDDSPENLERLRTELERRMGAVAGSFETKGLCIVPGRWPVACPDPAIP